MHLHDVLSLAREKDDTDMLAWYSYYKAACSSCTDPHLVTEAVSASVAVRRPSEEDDARLIIHNLLLLSTLQGQLYEDDRPSPVPAIFTRCRQGPTTASGHAGAAQNVADRVWSLIKSPQWSNAFCQSLSAQAARAIVYDSDYAISAVLTEAATSVMKGCGFKFTQAILESGPGSATSPSLTAFSARFDIPLDGESTASKPSPFGTVNALVHELDSLLDCATLPFAAAVNCLAKGFSISVTQDQRDLTTRLLIRLAHLKLRTNRLIESLMILDDIEALVTSNSCFSDVGLFFLVRCRTLVAVSALVTVDDRIDLLVDAFKACQSAVTAFDNARSLPKLSESVVMCGILANKLEAIPIRNFYAVKYHQIAALRTASDVTESVSPFFPSNESSDDVPVGQPKLPSEITNSPKANKKGKLVCPLSPPGRGRGIQTLVNWTRQ